MTPEGEVLEQGSGRAVGRRGRGLRFGAGAAVAGLALLVVQQAGRTSEPALPRVQAVSVEVAPDQPVTAPVLIASFTLTPPQGGRAWRLAGLEGPGATPVVAPTTGGPTGEQTLRVPVDCTVPGVRDASTGRYALLLEQTGAREGPTRRLDAPGAADLRAAVRRVCWDAQEVHVRVVGVVPDGRDGPGVLRLRVTVADIGPTPLRLRVLDVPHVATVDAGELQAGGLHVFTVLLPTGCPGTAGPVELGWAVGPPGGEPAGTVRTVLDAVQAAVVQEAARTACGPVPPLSVDVEQVTAAPAIVAGDRAFRLRLAVRSAPGRALLGQDPTAHPADVPAAFTTAAVWLAAGTGTGVVTWTLSCRAPSSTRPSLPVQLETGGTTWSLEAPLRSAALARAVAAACAGP